MQKALYSDTVRLQVDGTIHEYEAGQAYALTTITSDHVARGVAQLVDTPDEPATEVAEA